MSDLIDFSSWILPVGYYGKEPVSDEEFEGYEYYRLWWGMSIRLVRTIGDKDGVYADFVKPKKLCLERRVSSFKDLEDPNTDEITEKEYYRLCLEYVDRHT